MTLISKRDCEIFKRPSKDDDQTIRRGRQKLVVATCEDADALHAEHGGDEGATRPPEVEPDQADIREQQIV